MVLEDKDIIQIDATVITGVFIFLTLSIGLGLGSSTDQRNESFNRFGLTLIIMLPFALSAISAMGSSHTKSTKLLKISLILMATGFAYLIAIMFYLMIINMGK